jgi:hypothetical protein
VARRPRRAIGVLQARDEPMPIGMALSVGWGADGAALWKLTVHGAEVPGRWIVVGWEFWLAQESGRGPLR